MGFPGGSVVKILPVNAGDTVSIPGLGRCPGGGNGTPLQYSCLDNSMNRGAWRAIVHGVTKSQTQLSDFNFHFPLSCVGEGNGNPFQCSCLEDPRDGGAWWAAISGVAQSRTQLRRLSSSSSNLTFVHKCIIIINAGKKTHTHTSLCGGFCVSSVKNYLFI